MTSRERSPAVILIAATLIYCAPLFTNLANWGRQDWDQFTFRYETPRLALLRDHVLPTWNPYANGGTVLLAHPDSPVLSPWYGIFLVLGAPLGLRVQVAAFMALGSIGMSALLIRLGNTRAGAIAGGLVFMMSSLFALHIAEGHLEWSVLGLMPWLAILILRLEEGVRTVILAALLVASVVTFGAVYIPAIYLPFFTVWILLDAIRTRRWRPAASWVAVLVLAALLASVKLLPMRSFVADHQRELEAVSEQSTPVRLLLIGLLDPRQARLYQAQRGQALEDGHFGKTLSRAESQPLIDRLDRVRTGYYGFHEYACYIGVMGILMAAVGVVSMVRRLWPLYGAGLLAIVVSLGSRSPIDLWDGLRHLPLYEQLHVPSRFLTAAVFVMAIAAGSGLSAVTGWLRGSRARSRLAIEAVCLALLYVELALMGRALFRDVFVVPPVELTTHATFAHRTDSFPGEERYRAVMASLMYPRLRSHSGVLDAYENLAVVRGNVAAPGDADYRGESYVANGRGGAQIANWTMSSVRVQVKTDEADTLILNQNFYDGWTGRRREAGGHIDIVPAQRSAKGLIAVPVTPQHTEVEFFYLPQSFVVGAWISATTLVACLVGFAIGLW